MNIEEYNEFLGSLIISTIEQEEHLGEKIRKDCINYILRINKAKNNLEKSIESINNKLADKELRVVNDRIEYLTNECRIARLKAIRMKCKEILDILGGKE